MGSAPLTLLVIQLNMLIPCIIGQNLWDDMGHSEDVINENDKIKALTTVVRPTNMHPADVAIPCCETSIRTPKAG